MKNLIITSASLLILFASFLFGWHKGKKSAKPELMTVVSEKVTWDTVKILEPVPVPELIIIEDTIYIERMVADTLEPVRLIKQIKTYQDSTYTAIVSGYNPSLDYIETYSRDIVQHIAEVPKRWEISALAGVNFTGQANPYIAGEVAYNRRKLTVSAQVGRDVKLKQNFIALELSLPIARW